MRVVPPSNGSAYRMHHLMRGLSRAHEVRQFSQPRLLDWTSTSAVVTPAYREHRNRNAIDAALAEACMRTWINPQAIFASAGWRLTQPRVLRAWLGWADVVLAEYPWTFAYCRRHASPETPVIYSGHNVELDTRLSNARAAGVAVHASPLLRWVHRLEHRAVEQADLVLAVSDADRDRYVERYGTDPAHIAVIPNGADLGGLRPLDADARAALRAELGLSASPTALYMAAVPKPPDLEGLKWVRRVAAELPAVTFVVLGGAVRAGRDTNVIATGLVADHRPYVRAADISLCPIAHGGGTKLKLLDGLAAGVPTVAFRAAVRGTALRDGEHLLVVEPDVHSLVRAIRELLADRGWAARLAAAGHAHVAANHDWEAIARRLEEVLTRLVERHRRPGRRGPVRGGPGSGIASPPCRPSP